MSMDNIKTSVLIPSQLPEYIRESSDYENFVQFIKSYYEWLEQTDNVLYKSKKLLDYNDIDSTTDEFLSYFSRDFLPSFPEEILIDKNKAIRFARELYQAKGVPDSFKFLFRILYDTDFDYIYNSDYVFRASDGTWYSPKSIKINSTNPNFLNIDNLRLFGETSKTIATVENTVLAGNKTEIFISNIQRLFQSGEYVRVVDNYNQDVLFEGGVLRAKIVGQISRITIDPKNRGQFYEVGDPVIVYGGLNSDDGVGAIAEVGTATQGSIQTITVETGGYGYTEHPNSTITVTNAPGASVIVGSLDPASNTSANVIYFTIDTLNTPLANSVGLIKNQKIGNTFYKLPNNYTANANTKLSDALTFESFGAYPISSVVLLNGGGGIKQLPVLTAVSRMPDTSSDSSNSYAYIKNIGILAPIKIANGGHGYSTNDTIVFTNGSGYGVYANIISVTSGGSISNVSYVSGSKVYPLGGMGYRSTALPSVSVVSSNVMASNAELFVPGILGDGASFSLTTDRIGSIGTINIIDPGEDYISTPNVSLKVQDIVVSNVTISELPQKGDIVYQGSNVSVSSYSATVNSISLLLPYANTTDSLYNLRVFNYTSKNKQAKPLAANGNLFIVNSSISMVMANTKFSDVYDETGVKTYGDGKAKASASFLNGLVISEGRYLSSRGHPSGYSVLQSDIYNNYTYQITVEKEISKYKNILMDLLHPAGMRMIGRYALKSNTEQFDVHTLQATYTGSPISSYTGYVGTTAEMYANFNNTSNNVIKFNYLAGSNIADFIVVGSTIQLSPENGPNVKSEIVYVDYVANTVTLKDNVWLSYANVATIQASNGSNLIYVQSLTQSYDLINNKEYSDSNYPLKDIVYVGDKILIANNTEKTVNSVDYINGIIGISSSLTDNSSSYMSVTRNLSTSEIILWNTSGFHYIPELVTEDGLSLTTEDDLIILIG